MTELEHFFLGALINFMLWHLFFKKYFVTEKDKKTWTEIMLKYFGK